MDNYYVVFFLVLMATFCIISMLFKELQKVALIFNIMVSFVILASVIPDLFDKIIKDEKINDDIKYNTMIPPIVDAFTSPPSKLGVDRKITEPILSEENNYIYKNHNLDRKHVDHLRATNTRKHYQKKYRKGRDVETHKKYFGHIFDERNKYNWVAIMEGQLDNF